MKPSQRDQRVMKICWIASHVILSPPSLLNDNHNFKLNISLPKLTHKTKTSTLNTAHLSAYNIKKALLLVTNPYLPIGLIRRKIFHPSYGNLYRTGDRTNVPPLWRKGRQRVLQRPRVKAPPYPPTVFSQGGHVWTIFPVPMGTILESFRL